MPTIRNIRRGYKAKRNGQNFEHLICNELRKRGWVVTRIPDGCKVVGANKFIRVKSPFDFVATRLVDPWNDSTAMFFDAKTVQGKTFSYSSIRSPHQLVYLHDIEQTGFRAGYVIQFQTLEKTEVRFFMASQLLKLRRGQSVSAADGELIF